MFGFGKKQGTIEVTFKPSGEMVVEGHNFIGKACDKAMAFIENLLGTVKKRTDKTDRFRQDVQNVRLH